MREQLVLVKAENPLQGAPCSGLAISGIVLCIEEVGPLGVIKYGF